MPKFLLDENGKYLRTVTTNDAEYRTMSWSNLLQDEEFRMFNIIINKYDGLCTLFVENVRGEILNQQAFHVSPLRGRWGMEDDYPFVANDDARTITSTMAYAFKPMLLSLGMVLVPGSHFYEIRKDLNKSKYLINNEKFSQL